MLVEMHSVLLYLLVSMRKILTHSDFCNYSAVQSERKPIDIVPRERHANCAASTQKIYIRKDLNSPLIATPTFISDTETDGSRSDLQTNIESELLNLHLL